jgi:hypothetical protein
MPLVSRLAWLVGGVVAVVAGLPHDASDAARRQAGLDAFADVYSVLTHPRCINCHTATDYPQQGDDRHRHLYNVTRGADGHGVAALQCASCHQQANADGAGVPGGPRWHLAPLSMAWQDPEDRPLPPSQICRQLTDSTRAHLAVRELVHHHESEPLVHWAWNPGRRSDGTARTRPPLTHAQLVAATRTWVGAGAPCPAP